MAASSTRFTQNSLGQSKTPIDSDHGIYRYTCNLLRCICRLLAQSGHTETDRYLSVIGGKADMTRASRSCRSDGK